MMLFEPLSSESGAGEAGGEKLVNESIRSCIAAESELTDVEGQTGYLRLVLPRLIDTRIESYEDWHALALASHFGQLLSSRYMVKYIAWCAWSNAGNAGSVDERILCLCCSLPGGEIKLPSVYAYLREPGVHGYYFARRLGIEAYWRGEREALQLALQRVAQTPADRIPGLFLHSELDGLLLNACMEKVSQHMTNLPGLFSAIRAADEPYPGLYSTEASVLFLGSEEAATLGMFTQGFDLFPRKADEPEPPAEERDRSGSWFPE
jgi:hypothetical protein